MYADEPFIGIDFGTCTSCMAWFNPKTGQAEILRNAEGDETTPSVVYFGDKEPLVGRHAEEMLRQKQSSGRVWTSVKRDLARPIERDMGGKRVKPVEAAALILGKLKADAEKEHFHRKIFRVVITFPAIFDAIERDKVVEVGRLAGFRDIETIEEPVAAALAYGRAGVDAGDSVLVYDLGGGTFDLALLVRDGGGRLPGRNRALRSAAWRR